VKDIKICIKGRKALYQNPQVSSTQNPPPIKHSWVRVLLVGLLLFIVTTIIMVFTGNSNLYPTVILLGNFLVPVTFVAFLYSHRHYSGLTFEAVAVSFGLGGVLGIIGASILESLLLPVPSDPNQGLSLSSALLVGLIEEGCKIVAVMIMARHTEHTSAMDGLLLGGAVGMGFAALESTGYAFTVFLASHGQVTVSIIETIIRGLFAPFGHGLWTGILGAALYRASRPHRFRITAWVIIVYLFVSLLHGLWDGLPHTMYFVVPPGIPISVTTFIISVIGIVGLFIAYQRSLAQQRQLLQQRAALP
jgi:RsiW-degrading membrane proteinase PrsW (M82 family)